MRPRKHILVVEPDPEQGLRLRFLLETRCWPLCRVNVVDCEPFALQELRILGADLVVANLRVYAGDDGAALAATVKDRHPEIPVLLFSDTTKTYERAGRADAFLPKGTRPVEFLDRVSMLLRRKRGPRKKPAAPAPVEQAGSEILSA